MASVDALVRAYRESVAARWDEGAASPQRIWFAIYDPRDERRLRARLASFEAATTHAGHGWQTLDLTGEFATWMSAHEYRESYFESPDDLDMALDDFTETVAKNVADALSGADENAVVALYGVGSLFGLLRVSRMIEMVSGSVRGRLLVFFPGEHDRGNYRLMDARDGWNYLAMPITAEEGGRH